MLTKLATFRGVSRDGEPLVRLFRPGDSLTKTAGSLMPEIQAWLRKYRPGPDDLCVLVNAMGASEYWGQNINGDIFYEDALVHDCRNHSTVQHPIDDFTGKTIPPYGYWTFHTAYPFVHHKNKDPTRAFGRVALAVWNARMHRVELVVILNKRLALQHGAAAVVDRILSGEFPDVSMGCFPAGTLVTMGDGTRKPIDQIVEGDEVMTHFGLVRKVTSTHRRQYKGSLYSIKAEAHRTVRCTKQHPWLVTPESEIKFKDDHSNLQWKDLKEGVNPSQGWAHAECLDEDPEYLLEPIFTYDERLSPHVVQPTKAQARMLGYYLAEGHLLRNKKGKLAGIELSTHKDDPIHREIEDLCSAYGTKNAPSTYQRANSEDSLGIYIFDSDLAEFCLKHAGVYSTEKKLSKDVLSWKPEMQRELLGAYANGDGCGTEDGSLKLSTSSKSLAEQWLVILPRLGVIPSCNLLTHKAGCGHSAIDTYEWVVHIGKQYAQRLRPVCAKIKMVEIEKAKNSRKIMGRYVVTPIREIDSIYAELEVFNLEVEGDKSFLVEGLAVHNCKVPYDVCTICGNKSRTRDDYCACVREIGMGKILDDGRRIGVVNLHPRFFDISFVFIGADKTAKMMAKLASGLWVPESVLEADLIYKTACGARDCRECVGGCKVKAASIEKTASLADSMYELRSSPGRYVSKQDLVDIAKQQAAQNGSKDSEIRARLGVHNGEVPASDPLDSGLLMGQIDNQLNPAGMREDGMLRTNYSRAEEEKLSSGFAAFEEMVGRMGLKDRAEAALTVAQYIIDPTSLTKREDKQVLQILQHEVRGLQEKTSSLPPQPTPSSYSSESEFAKATEDWKRHKFHKALGEGAVIAGAGALAGAGGWASRRVLDKIMPAVKDVGHSLTFNKFRKIADVDLGVLFEAAKKIPIGPAPTPNRAKFPFVGSLNFRGLRVDIENKPGDTRSKTSKTGHSWSTLMRLPYGEIDGTKAHDGDKLDVYVGPQRNAPNVYIIHQNFVGGPKDGEYDEDKTMLGFTSPEEAKAAYLAHYTSPKFFRSITTMAFPLFKEVIFDSEQKGEKVAEVMHKTAMDQHLKELFANAENGSARSRERTWRDQITGHEVNLSGSGVLPEDEKAKAARMKSRMEKLKARRSDPFEKKASADVKVANHQKWADIVKRVGPSKAVGAVGPVLSKNEPDLPQETLEQMGHGNLQDNLATSSIMGMVLKPREFQHVALSHMGKDELARQLDESNVQFAPSSEEVAPCAPLSPLNINPEMMQQLMPHLEEKSYLAPVVSRRVPKAMAAEPKVEEEATKVSSPLLSKVAGAYNWYRREMLKVAAEAPFVVPTLPELHARVYGMGLSDLFQEKSAAAVDRRSAALILGSIPLSLMYAAHGDREHTKGKDPGLLGDFFADHPYISALGVAAALREFLKTPKGQEVADKFFEVAKNLGEKVKK
jgi:hypothetical protein